MNVWQFLLIWLGFFWGGFLTGILGFVWARKKRWHLGESLILVWAFLFLGMNIFFGLEGFFRFVYDSSDMFLVTRVGQEWMRRHVKLNGDGFRDKEFEAKKPGVLRVGVIGDSFTLGHGIGEVEDRFSNILEKKLSEVCQERVEVYNLGRGGWNTKEEVEYLLGEGKGFNFDGVILAYTLNDITADAVSEPPEFRVYGGNRILQTLILKSYFFNFFYYRLVGMIEGTTREYDNWQRGLFFEEPTWTAHKNHFKKLKEGMGEKQKLLVVAFPFMGQLGKDYPYLEVHHKLDDFFEGEGILYLDMVDDFLEREKGELMVNRYDAHPNEEANKIVAQKFFENIELLVECTKK
jgi:hypothetical protein